MCMNSSSNNSLNCLLLFAYLANLDHLSHYLNRHTFETTVINQHCERQSHTVRRYLLFSRSGNRKLPWIFVDNMFSLSCRFLEVSEKCFLFSRKHCFDQASSLSKRWFLSRDSFSIYKRKQQFASFLNKTRLKSALRARPRCART